MRVRYGYIRGKDRFATQAGIARGDDARSLILGSEIVLTGSIPGRSTLNTKQARRDHAFQPGDSSKRSSDTESLPEKVRHRSSRRDPERIVQLKLRNVPNGGTSQ